MALITSVQTEKNGGRLALYNDETLHGTLCFDKFLKYALKKRGDGFLAVRRHVSVSFFIYTVNQIPTFVFL